jgi:hypothetical protein
MTKTRLGQRRTDTVRRDRPIVVYLTADELETAADIALMEADRSGSGVLRRAFGLYCEVKYPQMVKRLREDLRQGGGTT